VSWATHELENYFIQKHSKVKASFLAIALGAFAPDLITKGFVYGFHIGDWGFGAENPIKFHRGWPGAGFTHSLLFGVVIAALILRFTGSRGWALGFLIGDWAHVVTDINDTAGTMLFFPFSTVQITTGMWKHAAYTGRYNDAAAYYSSPGGLWDTFWLGIVLVFARGTLTKRYFREVVVPADPRVWAWIHRRFNLPERALVAIYRGWLFYGGCRIVAWTLFARFRTDYSWDPSWGGPWYIERVDIYAGTFWEGVWSVTIGAVLTAIALVVCWKLLLRRWWQRGSDPPIVERHGFLAAEPART